MTQTYQVAERLIHSDLALPELEIGSGSRADISFEHLPISTPAVEPIRWFRVWPGGSEDSHQVDTWMRIGEVDGGYLLRFPQLADFCISNDGTRIRGYAWPGVPLPTFRHLLLDQVLPLALSLGGELVLHASGAALRAQAIGIIGSAGAGKSTLAACLAHSGWGLLTDDCLVVRERNGEWLAFPYYAGLRLWPESVEELFPGADTGPAVAHYTHKQRIMHLNGERCAARGGVPLRRLFVLEPGVDSPSPASVALEPLTAAAAFMSLVKANFLLETRSASVLRHQFETISRLATAIPCLRLDYPRDFEVLPRVRDVILASTFAPVPTEHSVC